MIFKENMLYKSICALPCPLYKFRHRHKDYNVLLVVQCLMVFHCTKMTDGKR